MNLNKSAQRRNKIMAKKYFERHSTFLAIRKMQIKATRDFIFTESQWLRTQWLTSTVRKGKASFTVIVRNAIFIATLGVSTENFQDLKNIISPNLNTILLGISEEVPITDPCSEIFIPTLLTIAIERWDQPNCLEFGE